LNGSNLVRISDSGQSRKEITKLGCRGDARQLSDILKRASKGLENTEIEIRREKAEALGRTGERLEHILEELARLQDDLLSRAAVLGSSFGVTAGQDSSDLRVKVKKCAGLREQARQLRHYLVIQREAIGLRRHEDVDRQYPSPPPLVLSMFDRDGGSS